MRIIYFDMDCTQPDHLGLYGYSRPSSPNLDTLAESSVVFDNCFASVDTAIGALSRCRF